MEHEFHVAATCTSAANPNPLKSIYSVM